MSSDGSCVRQEKKAFELLHINLSGNEKLFIWFPSQTLRRQWAVRSGSMLRATSRVRDYFEECEGRITLVQLGQPRVWDVSKHRQDTESLGGGQGVEGSTSLHVCLRRKMLKVTRVGSFYSFLLIMCWAAPEQAGVLFPCNMA